MPTIESTGVMACVLPEQRNNVTSKFAAQSKMFRGHVVTLHNLVSGVTAETIVSKISAQTLLNFVSLLRSPPDFLAAEDAFKKLTAMGFRVLCSAAFDNLGKEAATQARMIGMFRLIST